MVFVGMAREQKPERSGWPLLCVAQGVLPFLWQGLVRLGEVPDRWVDNLIGICNAAVKKKKKV